MEKYEQDIDERIRWFENTDGYILKYNKDIEEGIYLEGLEKNIIDTDNI
jgi:hypothetical protein